MKFIILISMLTSLIFCSCATTYELTQFGDNTEISTKSDIDVEGELLFITDSSFFISNGSNEIYEIGFKKSRNVKISGYTNRGWIAMVVATAIPPIILSLVIQEVFPLAFLAIPAISALLYEAGTPPAPRIDDGQVNKYTSDNLKKYSRFPQGLSLEQFKEFSKNKTIKKIF